MFIFVEFERFECLSNLPLNLLYECLLLLFLSSESLASLAACVLTSCPVQQTAKMYHSFTIVPTAELAA